MELKRSTQNHLPNQTTHKNFQAFNVQRNTEMKQARLRTWAAQHTRHPPVPPCRVRDSFIYIKHKDYNMKKKHKHIYKNTKI